MCPKRTMWHQSPLFILVRKPSCPTSGWKQLNHDLYKNQNPDPPFGAKYHSSGWWDNDGGRKTRGKEDKESAIIGPTERAEEEEGGDACDGEDGKEPDVSQLKCTTSMFYLCFFQ